ncbi:exopolysaccharide biosynthesis polyprenyl glycosylphosphotransferase [Aeromicrobium sp. SORGH_AS981]|uniref:sugar transferase n=1 Tax=Aeromicrobium sp. SORGH_AS_0981 TaxID=3041802 RepID=UPI00285EBD8C|nr:sugar transferase [Aeromicrobium sp. SORGH_AS_0981]MDR6117557.1 exopolysaccharide biosynthesis polyprenyl glycosylphosphotransferase [Aeromicrobium sp. SORGH_AS_0981]
MTIQDVSRTTSTHADLSRARRTQEPGVAVEPPEDPAIDSSATHRAPWHKQVAHRVFLSDTAVLFAVVILGAVLRFGADAEVTTNGPLSVSYWTFGATLAVGWSVALQAYRTRDSRVLGDGVEEYRRIVRASVTFFGLVAIASLVFKIDSSRGYLAITFPLGLLGLIVTRRVWRSWLNRQRQRGAMITNALVIGGMRSAEDITRHLGNSPQSGVRVTGVWVPDRATSLCEWLPVPDAFVPVMGTERNLDAALSVAEAEMVIVTDTEHLGHAGLKELTWELESLDVDLLVSPNVVDVSGSRIQLSRVGTMPFLSVDKPTYGDAATWPKQVFDRLGATALLVLTSPLLVGAALLVRLTSAGPIFYRQERIGKDGQPFAMIKFRSMHPDADQRLASLIKAEGAEVGPLAKLTNDPRLTPVGGFLRRFSLDELPQLFNVLTGSMSLVGPRPQRQFEVDLYDHIARRRLAVLPGMTGLWQVSGRSDLSWEDTVRLDTYYVENWSLVADLAILWRTVRAVLGRSGAR